jgi:hypothetical protein
MRSATLRSLVQIGVARRNSAYYSRSASRSMTRKKHERNKSIVVCFVSHGGSRKAPGAG